jgi:HK97 gp10 family phage protein
MAKSYIKGLDSWERWISSIPDDVEEDVQQVVAETAYNIEADAKRLVPVDTGHLRRSISTELNMVTKGYQATVGTNISYAQYIEFGTSKMDAKPFLIPAYLKWKPKLSKQLQDVLNRVGD